MFVQEKGPFDVAIAVFIHISLSLLTVHIFQRYIAGRLRLTHLQRHLIGEFCCSFVTSIISYERGLLKERYGRLSYVLASISAGVIYSHVADGLLGSPSSSFNQYLRKRITSAYFLYSVAAQVAGAFASYYCIRLIWAMGLSQLHRRKAQSVHICKSPLTVSIVNGFLIEAALTLVHAVCSILITARWGRSERARVFNASISVALVFAGLSYTGAMFSPSLALTLIFGCKGIGIAEFLFIYWAGPALGVVCANYLDDTFNLSSGPKQKPPLPIEKTSPDLWRPGQEPTSSRTMGNLEQIHEHEKQKDL